MGTPIKFRRKESWVSEETHDPSWIDEDFFVSLDAWKTKLGLGARKVFDVLLQDPETPQKKETLAQATGYAIGGGFNNNIYELTGAELVRKTPEGYIVNPQVLDL